MRFVTICNSCCAWPHVRSILPDYIPQLSHCYNQSARTLILYVLLSWKIPTTLWGKPTGLLILDHAYYLEISVFGFVGAKMFQIYNGVQVHSLARVCVSQYTLFFGDYKLCRFFFLDEKPTRIYTQLTTSDIPVWMVLL